MASGQLAGQYFLAAGSDPGAYRELGRGVSNIFDNAIGSDGYYVNGADKPPTEGVIFRIGRGPHVGPGENLYVGLVSTTTDGVDSDDTLAVLHIQIARYRLTNGGQVFMGTKMITAVGDRNTDTALGGVPDDRLITAAIPDIVYAFGPVPAGEAWKVYGPIRLDIRDDTA